MGPAVGDAFGDINELWSCATVYESSYSRLFGIPVALIGMVGFVVIGVLSFGQGKAYRTVLGVGSALGLLFMLYLMWAEFFVLKAACLYCVVVFLIMATITALSFIDSKNIIFKYTFLFLPFRFG